MLRVAGIFHCAIWLTEAGAHEIEAETVESVAGMVPYFISHAKAAFTSDEMSETARDARELYRRIAASRRASFFKTDLNALVGNNWKKDRMNAALAELQRAQYIDLFSGVDDVGTKNEHWVLLGDVTPPDEFELN